MHRNNLAEKWLRILNFFKSMYHVKKVYFGRHTAMLLNVRRRYLVNIIAIKMIIRQKRMGKSLDRRLIQQCKMGVNLIAVTKHSDTVEVCK